MTSNVHVRRRTFRGLNKPDLQRSVVFTSTGPPEPRLIQRHRGPGPAGIRCSDRMLNVRRLRSRSRSPQTFTCTNGSLSRDPLGPTIRGAIALGAGPRVGFRRNSFRSHRSNRHRGVGGSWHLTRGRLRHPELSALTVAPRCSDWGWVWGAEGGQFCRAVTLERLWDVVRSQEGGVSLKASDGHSGGHLLDAPQSNKKSVPTTSPRSGFPAPA